MSNMSYCRFQNTSGDFRDCLDAIAGMVEGDQALVEDRERDAAERLFAQSIEMVQQLIDATEVEFDELESNPTNAIKKFFDVLAKKKSDALDALSNEWKTWCTLNSLDECSADEIDESKLNPEQVRFVSRFLSRWEHAAG